VSTLAQKILKPASLTDCVFRNSVSGRLKHFLWRDVLNRSRAASRRADPAPDAEAARVAGEIAEKGLVLGEASGFLSPAGRQALAEAAAMIRARSQDREVLAILEDGANRSLDKDYLVHLVPFTEEQAADSALLKLALDPRLLRIVAGYMGLSPQLHAIGAWLNFPTGAEAKKSQLWHRDPEDLKTVKVFIYLDAVTDENGPFSYIHNSHPFGSECDREPRHAHPRRVTDEEMETAFPASRWFQCTGPANTMVIADTVGFHRGGNVARGKRLLITFTYTSGTPQVKRWLKVKGRPDWIADPLQRAAL
jgi:hypothetical protein